MISFQSRDLNSSQHDELPMQPVEHLYAQPLPKRQRQLHHRHSNSSQDRINVGQGFHPRNQPAKHHNRQASYVKMKIWFDVQAIITNCDFYSHRSRPRRPEQLSNLWIQGKRNDHQCSQLQRFAIKVPICGILTFLMFWNMSSWPLVIWYKSW